jgi:ATP-binding cassette subfamily F protein 3
VLLSAPDLLVLDEPTNHLDIPSQEILQEVLADYQGTILLVSHDRYLIDAIGTQIWEIEPGEASMRVFQGAYSQYRAWLEAQRLAEQPPQAGEAVKRPVSSPGKAEEKRRKQRLKEVEKQIEELEGRLAALGAQLENPPADLRKVQILGSEYVQFQKEWEGLIEEWEKLQ